MRWFELLCIWLKIEARDWVSIRWSNLSSDGIVKEENVVWWRRVERRSGSWWARLSFFFFFEIRELIHWWWDRRPSSKRCGRNITFLNLDHAMKSVDPFFIFHFRYCCFWGANLNHHHKSRLPTALGQDLLHQDHESRFQPTHLPSSIVSERFNYQHELKETS